MAAEPAATLLFMMHSFLHLMVYWSIKGTAVVAVARWERDSRRVDMTVCARHIQPASQPAVFFISTLPRSARCNWVWKNIIHGQTCEHGNMRRKCHEWKTPKTKTGRGRGSGEQTRGCHYLLRAMIGHSQACQKKLIDAQKSKEEKNASFSPPF